MLEYFPGMSEDKVGSELGNELAADLRQRKCHAYWKDRWSNEGGHL